MIFATLDNHTRDGVLALVSRDRQHVMTVPDVAPTLQYVLDNWDEVAPALEPKVSLLEVDPKFAMPIGEVTLRAPLPRAYEWIDASAYINHVRLARRARNAEPPATLLTEPMVYQGGSSVFMNPTSPIHLTDPEWGLDFEAEVVVMLADTPQGTRAADAHRHVRLISICNDVTWRNLVPGELAKGFGFFQSKPATTLAPFALTPDELGPAWRDGRVHQQMIIKHNGTLVGDPFTGPEMHFSFFDLIEYITKTRDFTAGTILGSGTVSNHDERRGVGCLAERRAKETIAHGAPRTPWMQAGDSIQIDLVDEQGRSVCGSIHQAVQATALDHHQPHR